MYEFLHPGDLCNFVLLLDDWFMYKDHIQGRVEAFLVAYVLSVQITCVLLMCRAFPLAYV